MTAARHVVVCMKQVLDPEAPPSTLRLAAPLVAKPGSRPSQKVQPRSRSIQDPGLEGSQPELTRPSIGTLRTPAVTAPGTPPLLNPYDNNALHAALGLRDRWGGSVTVVSVAPNPSANLFRRALAAGADRVVALKADESPDDLIDPSSTVERLAGLVGYAGAADVVLTGRRAADSNRGTVGTLLAAWMGWPCVTLACSIAPASAGGQGRGLEI